MGPQKSFFQNGQKKEESIGVNMESPLKLGVNRSQYGVIFHIFKVQKRGQKTPPIVLIFTTFIQNLQKTENTDYCFFISRFKHKKQMNALKIL